MAKVQLPVRLRFDATGSNEDYLFKYEVDPASGQITGEVRTIDDTTKISDLTGSRKPGVNPLHTATVMNFIFQLRGDLIFLGGRAFGIFFDGRLRALTPRAVPGIAATLFEPGDTGTGGGHQTTFLNTEPLEIAR